MENVHPSRQNKYINVNDTQAKEMATIHMAMFQRNRHTKTSQNEKHK